MNYQEANRVLDRAIIQIQEQEIFEATVGSGKQAYTVPWPTKKGMPAKRKGWRPKAAKKKVAAKKELPDEPEVKGQEVEPGKATYVKPPPKFVEVSFMGKKTKVYSPYIQDTSYKSYQFFKGAKWAQKILEEPKKELERQEYNVMRNIERFKYASFKSRNRAGEFSTISHRIKHPLDIMIGKLQGIVKKKAGVAARQFDPFWHGLEGVASALDESIPYEKRYKWSVDKAREFFKKYADMEFDSKGKLKETPEQHFQRMKKELVRLGKKRASDRDAKEIIGNLEGHESRKEAARAFLDARGTLRKDSAFHQMIDVRKFLGNLWIGKK